MAESTRTPQPPSAFGRLTRRVGSHAAIYALASGTALVSGILSVAVFTRALSTSQVGELAVLMVSQSLLTLLYNLCTLQGTMAWTFGTSADDDGGLDEPAARATRRVHSAPAWR